MTRTSCNFVTSICWTAC